MKADPLVDFGPLLMGLILVFSGPDRAPAQEETTAATRQYAAAARLQNLKSYDLAAEAWEKFTSEYADDPRLGQAYFNLGVCYYLDGNLDLAQGAFQTVIGRFPKLEKIEAAYLYLGAARYSIAQKGKPEMYDSALQTFDALAEKFPQGEFVADALYYRGECLYMLNEKAEAAQSYGELVYKYPKHRLVADALYALGVCQEDLGEQEAAGTTYDRFLASFPQHELATEVNMRRADTLFRTGQYDGAIKRFVVAAATDGFAMADYAMVRQADCLAEKKQYAEAAALYVSVAKKFPQSKEIGRATLAGGKCYYLAAKYAEARDLLARLVAGGGAPAYEAGHWVARCWLREKQPAKALEAVEKIAPAAEADKSPWAAQLLMDQADAVYETPKRSRESIQLYQSLATKYTNDPVAPQALYMAAFVALEEGQTAEARKQADAFLARYAKHELTPDVIHIKAECHLLLAQLAEAQALYEQLLKQYPEHPDAELWKVRRPLVLHLQKKYQETIDALQPVIAEIRRPDLVAEARYLVGSSQLELKQYQAAAASLAASMAAAPKWRRADETLLALSRAYRQLEEYEKAKASVRKLIAEFPESKLLDRAHYRLGEYSYLSGDFKSAAAEYRKVVESWPQSSLVPHALHELGCAQVELKDNAGSEKTLSRLVEEYPEDPLIPSARFTRAMARYRLQKYAPAIEDLQAFLPTNAPQAQKLDARYLLGLCQMALDQHEAAVATFQSLLKDDPQYANADNAMYQLAWAMKLSGKEEEAAGTFGQLTARYADSPRAAEAFYHVGEFRYAQKDYKKAAVAYFEAQEEAAEPDLREKATHKLAWSYYHQDDFDRAQQAFRSQRTTFPEGSLAADAAFMEAECFFKQEKFQEALDLARTHIENPSENGPGGQGDHTPEASGALAAFKNLSNKDFQTLWLLHAGQAAAQLKDWNESLRFLDQCTDQFPDSPYAPQAYYERGWAYQNLGDAELALRCYEKVISLTDAEVAARAQFMIGELQFGRKEHADAVRSYFKVIYGYSYPTWQAEATFEAARCFEVMRKTDQAVKLYRELIEKHPKSEKVAVAKDRLRELAP